LDSQDRKLGSKRHGLYRVNGNCADAAAAKIVFLAEAKKQSRDLEWFFLELSDERIVSGRRWN